MPRLHREGSSLNTGWLQVGSPARFRAGADAGGAVRLQTPRIRQFLGS